MVGAPTWVCAEVKIMDRKLAEPSHQLIDKICDQREGAICWLWHSLLIGNGRRDCVLQTLSHCMHIVSIHYVLGRQGWENPRLPWGGGVTQEGGKRKSKQKWEQNYGSEYISKGSLGLHSAEGFHGVFKSWHGAVLQGLYRFRREMHCLDLHYNHVDTSLSK